MHVTGRLAAATLVTAALVVVGSAAAAPAATGVPATYVVVPTTTAAVRTPVRVVVTRISRAHPVAVRWGDGTHTTLRARCSAARAAAHPVVCGRTVSHRYLAAGSYSLRATRDGVGFVR